MEGRLTMEDDEDRRFDRVSEGQWCRLIRPAGPRIGSGGPVQSLRVDEDQ